VIDHSKDGCQVIAGDAEKIASRKYLKFIAGTWRWKLFHGGLV